MKTSSPKAWAPTTPPFVHTWIHHGFVTIKDEKMSKSLNNFLTIREVLRDHTPEALRFFVFSSHYRTPLDYSENALKDAQLGLARLYSCLADLSQLPSGDGHGQPVATVAERQKIESLPERFQQAMDNDFNTAQAFGHLFDAVKPLNRIRQALPKNPAPTDLALLQQGARSLKELANILGLLRQDPIAFGREIRHRQLAAVEISAAEIDELIQARLSARSAKNWARADEIRDELLAKHILLKDGPEGTSWQVDS
jgi:cysteinyl-tRNA synthetase